MHIVQSESLLEHLRPARRCPRVNVPVRNWARYKEQSSNPARESQRDQDGPCSCGGHPNEVSYCNG